MKIDMKINSFLSDDPPNLEKLKVELLKHERGDSTQKN